MRPISCRLGPRSRWWVGAATGLGDLDDKWSTLKGDRYETPPEIKSASRPLLRSYPSVQNGTLYFRSGAASLGLAVCGKLLRGGDLAESPRVMV